jgi:hypothetical protein
MQSSSAWPKADEHSNVTVIDPADETSKVTVTDPADEPSNVTVTDPADEPSNVTVTDPADEPGNVTVTKVCTGFMPGLTGDCAAKQFRNLFVLSLEIKYV